MGKEVLSFIDWFQLYMVKLEKLNQNPAEALLDFDYFLRTIDLTDPLSPIPFPSVIFIISIGSKPSV